MHTPYIQRMVNLEPLDYRLVREFAEEKGLGRKGFSAALRFIIRDWYALQIIAASSQRPPPYPDGAPIPGHSTHLETYGNPPTIVVPRP